jgi:hypothetical protein
VSLWEERAGRNEALFRAINEEIRSLQRPAGGSGEFICECTEGDCTVRVHVSLVAYEAVRANPRRFFVHPGHERPEIELVVETADGYLVVEKQGVSGRIAENTDPNSQGD